VKSSVIVRVPVPGREVTGLVKSMTLLTSPRGGRRIGETRDRPKHPCHVRILEKPRPTFPGLPASHQKELVTLGQLPAEAEQARRPRHARRRGHISREDEDIH